MVAEEPSSCSRELLTGGEAVAHAMRQIDPDVVPVYPITPQTPIIQGFAKFVADGRAHGELVNVESEHSAMSAAIGAALAGARTMTATSSQGLALMAEVVYIAASMRAPIVMAVGNRALSGPINIHCDHSDSMLIRDSGVVQLFAENAQEAYDLMVMAPRIAEHPDVLLPVLVCQDGFTITHSAEPVELLADERRHGTSSATYARPASRCSTSRTRRRRARSRCRTTTSSSGASRLPRSRPRCRCSTRSPTEFERALAAAATAPVEAYRLDDAERAIVALGSTRRHRQGRRRRAARRRARPSACCKIVSFRPFPAERVARAARAACDVGDRARPRRLAGRRAAALRRARRRALRQRRRARTATSTGSAAATCIPRTCARSSRGDVLPTTSACEVSRCPV